MKERNLKLESHILSALKKGLKGCFFKGEHLKKTP